MADMTVRNTANLIANINNGIMVGQNFGNINHESGCHTDEQRFDKCTKALWVTDPDVDREYVVNTKGSPVSDTCDWIWQDCTFSDWLDGSSSKTLWIAGGPGKGKTTISVHITALLEKRCNVRNEVFAYFFCDHRDANRNSACAILRTLIHQIIDQKRGLHSKVYPYVREDRRAEATMQSRDALWRIVTELLHEQELEGLVYLIDGLDECDDGTARWLAQKLSNLHTNSSGKDVGILVASRNIASMKFSSKIDLDTIQDPGYNESITRFIDARVADMADQVPGCTLALQNQVKESLRSRSGNSFLWIGCVMGELSVKETPTEIESSLAEFPTGLCPLYNRLLHQVHSKPQYRSDCIKLLHWVAQAMRPMSLAELAAVLDIDGSDTISVEQRLSDRITWFEYWFRDDEHTNALLPLLSYATLHWPYHARLLGEDLAMNLLNSRGDTFFKSGGMAYTGWWWSFQMRITPLLKQEMPAKFAGAKGFWHKKQQTIPPMHLSAALGVLPWMESFSTVPGIPRSDIVNRVDLREESPLNYATEGGHQDAITWLCDREVTMDDRSVFSAAAEGHASVLKYFLDHGGNPNVRARNFRTGKSEDETALWDTCGQGLEDVVHVLLNAGADTNALSPPSDLYEFWGVPTPAFVTACFGGSMQLVEILLTRTKDLHLYLDYGLEAAIMRGHEDVIRFLLPRISTLGHQSEREKKLLYSALRFQASSSIVEPLLDFFRSSADLVVRFGNDGLPWRMIEFPFLGLLREEILCETEKYHIPKNLNSHETLQMLLKRGATPTTRMLRIVTEKDDVSLLELFLKRDVDMSMSLHVAAKHGSFQAAKLLIAKGVAINGTNGQKKTPLIIAAENGFAKIVELLLQNGASPKTKDKGDKNARMRAEAGGHADVVQVIDDWALKVKK
ncbi:uncharacterized protein J4E87_001428 [Alternaria ethzedia]|uniref:uncharacterized protein n=1 Tax=Alternaria ethzedia TaxID=181014 RepID=UPI0020C357C2|nr:uncharacterized protein J4E87_001428 [Alternaria ethzedia]KAI4634256.1 hypothetical protein J4E87_001428 [Alternaria ethzedia]